MVRRVTNNFLMTPIGKHTRGPQLTSELGHNELVDFLTKSCAGPSKPHNLKPTDSMTAAFLSTS